MPKSSALTVDTYVRAQPPERQAMLNTVLKWLRSHVESGFEEGILYGMPSWFVPLSRYPNTYNGQPLTLVSLGAKKNHFALYLMGLYGDPGIRERFEQVWKASGKKLDLGKSCLRFKTEDDLAWDALAEAFRGVNAARFIEVYETHKPPRNSETPEKTAKKGASKKTSSKSAVSKKRPGPR